MCCFCAWAQRVLSAAGAQRSAHALSVSLVHPQIVFSACVLMHFSLCAQRMCSAGGSACVQLCVGNSAQAFLSLTLIVLCRSPCHGRSASGLEGHASRCDLDAREDVQLPGDSPSFLGCNDEPMNASSCPQGPVLDSPTGQL